MEYAGFIKGLNPNAVRELEVTIPRGTILRFTSHKLDAIRLVDAQTAKVEGQMSKMVLDVWKQKGGPMVSLSGDTSGIAHEDYKISGAILVNGSVVQRELFVAAFGEDKSVLYEEILIVDQGSFLVLSNPMLVFQPQGKDVILVDINDIPEIASGKMEILKAPPYKREQAAFEPMEHQMDSSPSAQAVARSPKEMERMVAHELLMSPQEIEKYKKAFGSK
jgi:hypothetical protein